MPTIPSFEHNGITIVTSEPMAPMGPAGYNVVCIVGTAPDKAVSVQFNNPVRISSLADHGLIDSTGNEQGTLIQTLKKTHQKTNVVIYAVVVDEGADAAATKANIIGGVDPTTKERTGIEAISECLERPTIIGAPGHSSDKAVIDSLATMGKRLRARVVADGPNTTTGDVITLSGQLGGDDTGHDRVVLCEPGVSIYSAAAKGYITAPASAVVIGALASVKQWQSPQNQGLLIDDTSRTIEYNIEDTTTEADLLNKNGITTIAHTDMGGFSVIGNRTVTGRFISHVGLEDTIARKLSATSQQYMGQNLTESFITQCLRRINAFLQDLRREDALIDAYVQLHPSLNSVSNYTNGKWYVQLVYGRYSPNEHTVFHIDASNSIVETYLEGLLNG